MSKTQIEIAAEKYAYMPCAMPGTFVLNNSIYDAVLHGAALQEARVKVLEEKLASLIYLAEPDYGLSKDELLAGLEQLHSILKSIRADAGESND